MVKRNLRRNRNKTLHTGIFEDRKQDYDPESHWEVSNGTKVKDVRFCGSSVLFPICLVFDVISRAKDSVQEDDNDCTDDRKEGDNGADPQGPGIRSQILGYQVGSGLSRELPLR